MARQGSFDPQIDGSAWFDTGAVPTGWFDADAIPAGAVVEGAGAMPLTLGLSAGGASLRAGAGDLPLALDLSAGGASVRPGAGVMPMTLAIAGVGGAVVASAGDLPLALELLGVAQAADGTPFTTPPGMTPLTPPVNLQTVSPPSLPLGLGVFIELVPAAGDTGPRTSTCDVAFAPPNPIAGIAFTLCIGGCGGRRG